MRFTSQSQAAPIWFNAQTEQVGPGLREGLMSANQSFEMI
jgi:hypothetical protein